jgi:hypothetical protein
VRTASIVRWSGASKISPLRGTRPISPSSTCERASRPVGPMSSTPSGGLRSRLGRSSIDGRR